MPPNLMQHWLNCFRLSSLFSWVYEVLFYKYHTLSLHQLILPPNLAFFLAADIPGQIPPTKFEKYYQTLNLCCITLNRMSNINLKWFALASSLTRSFPAGNYMFKVNNRNTRTKVWSMFKVYNKATETTLMANLMFLLLTLNK